MSARQERALFSFRFKTPWDAHTSNRLTVKSEGLQISYRTSGGRRPKPTLQRPRAAGPACTEVSFTRWKIIWQVATTETAPSAQLPQALNSSLSKTLWGCLRHFQDNPKGEEKMWEQNVCQWLEREKLPFIAMLKYSWKRHRNFVVFQDVKCFKLWRSKWPTGFANLKSEDCCTCVWEMWGKVLSFIWPNN